MMTTTMAEPKPDGGTRLAWSQDRRAEFRKYLESLLTHADVCRMFRRSDLTVMHWRRDAGLPYIRIPGDNRDTIRYDRGDVLRWAKERRKRVFLATDAHEGGSEV